MNRNNWTAIAVFVVVVLLVFLVGVSLMGGWRTGGWGIMGPGMMGGWGYSPFGWIGMIFMWLIPVGVIALVVMGVAWFLRSIGSGGNPPITWRTCTSCGRSIQSDWRNCPYCGTLQAQ